MSQCYILSAYLVNCWCVQQKYTHTHTLRGKDSTYKIINELWIDHFSHEHELERSLLTSYALVVKNMPNYKIFTYSYLHNANTHTNIQMLAVASTHLHLTRSFSLGSLFIYTPPPSKLSMSAFASFLHSLSVFTHAQCTAERARAVWVSCTEDIWPASVRMMKCEACTPRKRPVRQRMVLLCGSSCSSVARECVLGVFFNDLSKCVCNGVSCVNVVLECVKCGSVSAPAFRVTQPICRLSGCSSVATVIGNDGQPELWLKLHRGWPRMTNVVRCVCVCTRVWRSCVCECVFPEFYWDRGHVERGEEEIRLQQRKYITEHLSSNKITCIICCGNPCPPPFLPCLALSLFFLSSTFSLFLFSAQMCR